MSRIENGASHSKSYSSLISYSYSSFISPSADNRYQSIGVLFSDIRT